jgi:hypothetical protein
MFGQHLERLMESEMDRFALDKGLLRSSVSQAFTLAVTLWLRKINTDPHSLAHVNIGYADDTYPK